MGYRLATLFALYNLDEGPNNSGSGHISALVSSGEITTYFRKGTASRDRIVGSLYPEKHFSLECSYEQSRLPLTGPTTSCQVLKDGKPVANSGPMQWGWSLSAEEVRKKTGVKAASLLNDALEAPTANYERFTVQSNQQIQLVLKCFDRMYWIACKARYQPPDEVIRVSNELLVFPWSISLHRPKWVTVK